jgi:hypothetical protein
MGNMMMMMMTAERGTREYTTKNLKEAKSS